MPSLVLFSLSSFTVWLLLQPKVVFEIPTKDAQEEEDDDDDEAEVVKDSTVLLLHFNYSSFSLYCTVLKLLHAEVFIVVISWVKSLVSAVCVYCKGKLAVVA